jgi:hypothetical protein
MLVSGLSDPVTRRAPVFFGGGGSFSSLERRADISDSCAESHESVVAIEATKAAGQLKTAAHAIDMDHDQDENKV